MVCSSAGVLALVPPMLWSCAQLVSLCVSVVGIKCLSAEVSALGAAPNKDANSPEGHGEAAGEHIKSLIVRASVYKKHFLSSVCRLPPSVCDGTELCPLGYLPPVHGMYKDQMRLQIRVWRCLHPSLQNKQELGVVMPSLETEHQQKSKEQL